MEESEMERIMRNYFQKLFTTTSSVISDHILSGYIVGREISDFCLKVIKQGKKLYSLNITNIVFIPKISHSMNLKNVRLIRLCTVIYKLIAKVIANQFQCVLEICIGSAQNAFVLGRHKRLGKKGSMALKLDMNKVYDQVEWGFLHVMMERMGFSISLIDLIIQLITLVSYSVIVMAMLEEFSSQAGGFIKGIH
ncbi:hypothetical protein J1N35_011579 [Gossypium stocksii]|uniref:Reverse transcriptase domain-containing protein n=1 Tax=Gossypium stocksii TaxID=47602 RepID=A0A9D3W2S0_9ROSI|nr:hypothetical protein J1N35_011579 [Gossypium stocksii]